MRGELFGEGVQDAADIVGQAERRGGRVGQARVGCGGREAFGVPTQDPAGVVCADHPGVRRSVLRLRAELDDGVEVGGAQAGSVRTRVAQHGVEPGGVLCVVGGVGRRQHADRGEQRGMGVAVEVVGDQRLGVSQTCRFEEKGAK